MADTASPPPSRGPNCWQCQHFAVSWDPRRPYACNRMGFKSPGLPALEVLRVDGQPCNGFSPKIPASPNPPSPDLAPAGKTAAQPPSRHWRA